VSYLRSVVPEASLLSDLAALRTDLRAGKTGSGPARRLYRYLLGPHAKRLEGADRLLIATSGPLSNVPFAALTMPDGGLVAGRLEIALVPSVASALRTPREYGELADLSMLSVGFAGGPPDLPRLRNAEGEATSVAARFAHAEVLLGGAATPEAIEARLSRVGILHVSAHALANLEDPGRSSVVLAGPVEGASHWMARRIRERPLDHIALVTLAGCETSRGDPTPAGHGWSLAQAFLAAGAGSVVGTLWPLSDEGSPLVMEHYYSELLRTGRPAFAVARTLTHFRDSPVAADAASLVVFSAAMGAAGSV
jgi:CHAT domain-containing protein